MKGVFQTKISPAYDDVLEEHYHFPKMYLNQVRATVGDWIVYYEPRRSTANVLSRGGRQAYFGMAKVSGVRPDEARPDHFYADVMDYISFDNAVPFRESGFYYETAMRAPDGSTNSGSAQRAVRNMPDQEFELILQAGFSEPIGKAQLAADTPFEGFDEDQPIFQRPLIETVVTRPFRDRAFTRQIQSAYDKRCAITGLRLINGGGSAEAQAAHIMPVEADGPDSVRNGMALSSTVHWMFDRGLVSVDTDFRILKAKNHVPPEIERMFHPSGFLMVPDDHRLRPHQQFLRYHRENTFRG